MRLFQLTEELKMTKQIIGGIATLAIGGTIFAVSQSDIVSNFSENSGMTQYQAQEYIDSIPEDELQSFSDIGQIHISDGNSMLDLELSIDCYNYTYEWERPSLSCQSGKDQLRKIGNDEIKLGKCYQSLDTDLGDFAKSKINECTSDIDMLNLDYNLPIFNAIYDTKAVTDFKNTNTYNKSVLEAALESE